MSFPNFSFEKKLWKKYKYVAGVDEVGRGCFAGPVVAGCVIFDKLASKGEALQNSGVVINDSKKLRPRQRERGAKWIKKNALSWGIGESSTALINRIGMGLATKAAFRKAIAEVNRRLEDRSKKLDKEVRGWKKSNFPLQNLASSIKPLASKNRIDFLLIDAFYIPFVKGLPVGRKKPALPAGRQKPIIKGDEKSYSIAAASIIAKVYRDKLMQKIARRHKVYGWGRNKGYGTREHQRAIKKYGLTRYHRKAFVRNYVSSQAR